LLGVEARMLIDDLPALDTFARIVSAGSLSAAARELDLSLSVVSKRLAHLESQLGVRLLHRTTRQQTLTDDGAQFHAQVLRILAEVERAARDYVGEEVERITPEELRARLASEDVVLVDVRPSEEYAAGHIEVATRASRRMYFIVRRAVARAECDTGNWAGE